ncbi:hypothetical protein BKE38_19590 [Pseudoroseomonas deserti]|uniref:Integrase n=2 Tax=Roseomonas TaxID=125216 RepID=A0A1V2GYY5_9PROT|nr:MULTISPECIES: hypothetical protein [Acetobacteraceae]APT57285.1 hypothetical protein RGI145_09400 [Roseomonas gilardii]ONG50077.1 hypothetical protein BKE38_19590 [Pseudoroseomonas deserti]
MTTHDRLPSRRAKLHAEKIASLLSLGPIGKVLASHFEERVSAAPQSTGQTVWTHVSVIRDVLSERGGTIDGPMFDALYTRLEASGMAPLSKATLYGGAMGIAKRLMDDGAIPAFKVPRRYAHKAVLAATPPPRRMTDGIDPDTSVSDHQFLEAVVDFAYAELETWNRKRALAAEIAEAGRLAYQDMLPRLDESLGNKMDSGWAGALIRDRRAELARDSFPVDAMGLASFTYCYLFAQEALDGIPLTANAMARDGGLTPAERRYARRMKFVSGSYPGLFPSVLCPSQDEAAALAVLLAAAHVNAFSIAELRAGCLRPTENPNVYVLAWHKRRAGGAMHGLAFPEGEDLAADRQYDEVADPSITYDSATGEVSRILPDRGRAVRGRSVPAVIRLYKDGATALRRAMGYREDDPEAPLLLTRPDKMYPGEKAGNVYQPSLATLTRAVEEFRLRFAEARTDDIPGVAEARFTLKSIRVSAIHQHLRARRDPAAVQTTAQHKGPRATAYYLRHRESMQIHSEETRRIVDAMETAVRENNLVVGLAEAPPNVQDIGHGAACRDRYTGQMPGQREGRPCDFFIGCLTCERAVVVATPLNYARILRWRDHLLSSRRRHDEAPARWERWIAPQLRVIEDALADFPADVALAGKEMASRLRLDFGAVW